MTEALIFLAFVLLAILFDLLDRQIEARHRQQALARMRMQNHAHRMRQTARRKRRALLLLGAALSHPITWHAVQEYVVHFVVYSGNVIPSH